MQDELLHICARRAVWGTDVYTDDSDPLCASIHAGWIRGAWPADVDVRLLEPDLRHVTLAADAVDWKSTVLEEPPTESPMISPHNKDLHITLLILPALQAYTGRIAHGVKSRDWGSDHDGSSFRIERIAWVDEAGSKAEERTATARRKRIGGLTNRWAGGRNSLGGTLATSQMPPVKLKSSRPEITSSKLTVAAA